MLVTRARSLPTVVACVPLHVCAPTELAHQSGGVSTLAPPHWHIWLDVHSLFLTMLVSRTLRTRRSQKTKWERYS